MNGQLICIGEILIDFFSDNGINYKANPGGAPANVAVCCSKLGGRSLLLTQVGEDAFGSLLIKALKDYGVKTEYVRLTSEANTGLAFVSLDSKGQRSFSFYRSPSADLLYKKEYLPSELFQKGNILHFGSVDLVDSPMKEAHKKAIEMASASQMLISFDPNLRYNLWPSRSALIETVKEFIPLADIVKVSIEELSDITGESTEAEGVKKVMKGRNKLLIVTKGGEGADAFSSSGFICSVPGLKPAHVVDTTGAGDTFLGAFLNRMLLSKKDSLDFLKDEKAVQSALEFANKAACFCVQSQGAMPAMPYLKDLR